MSPDARLPALGRLLAVVDRLRAPDGCPWDRKQTLESMAPFLVEEAHEALEAIEAKGDREIAEELGDVLMVVCLIARIAEEAGRFDLGRAADGIADKLVRRHPHVFGDVVAGTAEQALASWETIKQAERSAQRADDSALAGVPASLPALQRAHRICGKAVSAGFRWSSAAGAAAKVFEEQEELRAALGAAGIDGTGGPQAVAPAGAAQPGAAALERVGEELGDVLVSAAFLASYLDLDPERLCRAALRRFEGRFRAMEQAVGRPLGELPLERLVAAWQAAKERFP
jgi:MazG family protein